MSCCPTRAHLVTICPTDSRESSVRCSGEAFRAGDEDVCVICSKTAVGGAGLPQAGSVGGEVESAMRKSQPEAEEQCCSAVLVLIRI